MDAELKTEILKNLTHQQREAVKSESSYLRILAPAGAGKTETITRKIVYLLADGTSASSIVAFTFTNKAAREMKDRVYQRVSELLGTKRAQKLGEMFVGTIHSFCHEILTKNFNLGNYDIIDANQERAFVARHGWALSFPQQGYNKYCEDFLRSINVVHNELLSNKDIKQKNPDFFNQFKKYEKKLENHHLITFGQVIKLAVRKLEKTQGEIPGRQVIKHLIVDEYQDINPAQEELIKLLAINGNCYVVGDPRQCLYEWRGAHPASFARFNENENFNPCKTIRVDENWRSSQCIINVGNAVASNFEEPYLRPPMRPPEKCKPPQGKVIRGEHSDDNSEAKWIANQIIKLVKEDICNYSDIAILLRSVKTSADPILDQLKQQSIPYLVAGNTGLFRREETEAMGRIFCWCANLHWQEDPYNPNKVTEGEHLLEKALACWPGSIQEEFLRQFKSKLQGGAFSDLTESYQWLLVRLGVPEWDPVNNLENAARLANLGRFNTLLTDYETPQRLRGSKISWPGFLTGLAWFINQYARNAYEEQHLEELKKDIEAVQVSTVHQAKGLEWPIVFIPCLTDNRFPSSMAGRPQDWLISPKLFDRERYEGGVNSERKVFYVAVTRAQRGLVLSNFNFLNRSVKPSRFFPNTEVIPSEKSKEPFITKLDIDRSEDSELKNISVSELLDYFKCPAEYRFRNIWNYQPGIAERLGFGRAIHHVLSSLYKRCKEGADPLEILPDIMDEDFFLPFATRKTTRSLKKEAQKAIEWYIEEYNRDLINVEDVEIKKEFLSDPRIIISGRIDKILSSGDKVEIRDYKTAEANGNTVTEGFLQLQLYALTLEKLGDSVDKVSLIFPLEETTKNFESKELNAEEIEQLTHSSLKAIAKGKFPGRPDSEKCEQCDYKRICYFADRDQKEEDEQ